MKTLLYPFRFRDPLTGKWVRARYKATREDIAARYSVWELTGPPEVRDPIGGYFNPLRRLSANTERSDGVDREPQLSEGERFLVLLFLRRYVTYCARRKRWVQMGGAAQLHSDINLSTRA